MIPAISTDYQSFYPFIFHNIQLQEACWIHNEPYFTRRAIGEWLKYSHPRQAIENIIKRNPYIEDPRWSTVLSLRTVQKTAQGKKYKRDIPIPVYNPIGFQLIYKGSKQSPPFKRVHI